jgi:aldehyde:ferredoxin oxidoreductase
MNGYQGKILIADLSQGILTDEALNEKYAQDFLGGTGLASRYLFDLIDEDTDPLGPDNPLILMTGLLNGTSGPSVSRWGGATRSPLSDQYGDSNAGAWFGAELKKSGYDGIILKGRAASPVFLHIRDGVAEIKKADALWGLDTVQTLENIRKICKDQRVQIACIGPASEKGVLYGNIMLEHGHSLGRAGLGCVMGGKNLKAIAVRGKSSTKMADPEKFRKAAGKAMKEVKEAFLTQWMHEGGTASWVDSAIAYGDGPTRYYTAPTLEAATVISGATMAETCQIGHTACFGCPIACRKVLRLQEGKYQYEKVEGPEYESLIALGAMMGLELDMSTAIYLNEICNRFGFDTISGGASAGYAFYLFEQGILSEADTEGLKLTWGNVEAAIELLRSIGEKRGFGAVAAQGTRKMAKKYHRPPGEAVQTKGLEIPMHDPRAYHSMGLVYATAPRGADHNKSDGYQVDGGAGHPDLGLDASDRWGDEKAEMVFKSQNFRALTDSLGICHFAQIPFNLMIEMIEASTGWKVSIESLLHTGERIFQLQRALSCRLGITAADDRLPELILNPIPEGGQEGHVPDMEKMLPEYYQIRDWDPVSGKPSRKRLERLNMPEVADSIGAE